MQIAPRPQRRIRERFSRQDWEDLMQIGAFLRNYVAANTMKEADAVIELGERLIRETGGSQRAPKERRGE